MINNIINTLKNKFKKKESNKKEKDLSINDRLNFLENKNKNYNDLLYNLIIDQNIISNKINIKNRVYQDIEFFNDKNNNDLSIFSKINYTKTTMGKIYLQLILENPIDNINILKERQNLLLDYKKIIDKNKFIIHNLNEIKKIENDLLWFWDNENEKHLTILHDIIFLNITNVKNIDNYINTNELILNFSNCYKIFISPIFTIITPFSAIITPIVLYFLFRKKLPFKISIRSLFKIIFRSLFNNNLVRIFIKNELKAKIVGYLLSIVYIILYFYNVYNSFKISKNINKIINLIHNKMNKVNLFLRNTESIINVCQNLKFNCYVNNIKFSKIKENLNDLNQYLKQDIFNNTPSLFSNKGKILKTYRIFINIKNKLSELFKYIAMIDVINSSNLLINNYNKYTNNYSFVEYSNSKYPLLKSNKLWHPYLDKSPIMNNLTLKNNMLITGPNAAGKSTFIKSVMLNIILSQTLGISSSSNFEITPFKNLDTYLHIPDIKGESSLFETEMYRSKDYIDKIKNTDDLSFIIMDEIFSSTNYIEGFSGAYAILKKLSTYKNSLYIVTTHYTKLSNLEEDTNGKIINYKFEINRDSSDNILFNYKLKKGFSNQFIALELLKNNDFDKDIIDNALNVSKTIKIEKVNSKKKINKNEISKQKNKNKIEKEKKENGNKK